MLRTVILASLLACYSVRGLAQAAPAEKVHNPSVPLESAPTAAQHVAPNNPRATVISVRASCQKPPEPSPVRIIEVYWTNGLENERVVSESVNHYVDLNLVVRTADFTPGECIEAVISAEDNGEVADNIQKIVLRGQVNEEGIAYFNTPLKGYTLKLLGDD